MKTNHTISKNSRTRSCQKKTGNRKNAIYYNSLFEFKISLEVQ